MQINVDSWLISKGFITPTSLRKWSNPFVRKRSIVSKTLNQFFNSIQGRTNLQSCCFCTMIIADWRKIRLWLILYEKAVRMPNSYTSLIFKFKMQVQLLIKTSTRDKKVVLLPLTQLKVLKSNVDSFLLVLKMIPFLEKWHHRMKKDKVSQLNIIEIQKIKCS